MYNDDDISRIEESRITEPDYGYHKPGKAITCMVLGICSVSLWEAIYITSIPCMVMGIIAVVMASREQNNIAAKYSGFLKAGKITGVFGIVLASLYTFIMTCVFASL